MASSPPPAAPRLISAVVVMLGIASLALTASFLAFGPRHSLLDLNLPNATLLAFDATLCLLFFLQHSVMLRRGFRRRLAGILPYPYHGLLYTFASALALFAVVLLWQPHPHTIFDATGVSRLALRAVLLLAGAGFLWSILALESFDPFGLQSLRRQNHELNPKSDQIHARGPYRWVRHPIYFFSLLVIWAYPALTADRLLFNTLWTIWIVVGTILEERDLVTEFGEQYTGYQHRVPMLLPWRRP